MRGQSCRDVEHVFVDGGSVDGTLALLAACPGNTRLLRDVGGGISRAMNAGIAAASGDIVAHLHADDYYADAEVLATVESAFAQADAAGRPLDWVFGAILVWRDGRLLPAQPPPPFSYRAFAAGRATVPHPAVFIRRAAFARVGLFDERLRYAMDIDLWLRLGAGSRPGVIARPLAVFREHAGSASSSNKRAARREEFAVRRRHAGRAPFAFAIYCLRYLKRRRALAAQATF